MQTTVDDRRDSRWLGHALQWLLVLAFVTGGSSQISGWDDTTVQLLSLPILAWGLWAISGQRANAFRNGAIAVAALIAMVPLLQLMPLPEGVWRWPDARQQLADDIAAAGGVPEFRWSLDPSATRAALLFLLPPLAAFAATLATGRTVHRRLLLTIMLLGLFSLLLGFAQLGVPRESLLNPFPRWAAQLNGVFANQNHQGISLVLTIIVALTGMLTSAARAGEGLRQAWTPWLYGFVALFALCALPLTNSRASVLIAVFAVAAVPLALGFFDPASVRRDWRAKAGLAGSLGLIALGVWGTLGWMRVDAVDELRSVFRATTVDIGAAHSPLGAGIGAFVPAFEQAAPPILLRPYYINHAHNEFVQWWLEGGLVAMVVLAAALLALSWAAARALRVRKPDRAQAVVAVTGLAALLGHSWVDYPMRTVSLATVAAVLAGILVVRAGHRHRDVGAHMMRGRERGDG